ncbi:IS1634 family transposase, partial [Duncaniella muris]
MKFFQMQGRRRLENEYLAYDTSSISSYSEQLSVVKYGKNKDHAPLPQINLLLVFGEESYLPFYYRRLAGNIPDVSTVKVYLKELELLGYSKVKVVKDRGFYSVENINALYKEHIKFVIGGKTNISFVKEIILEEKDKMRKWDRYNEEYGFYIFSKTIKWDYEQVRPYKGDVL